MGLQYNKKITKNRSNFSFEHHKKELNRFEVHKKELIYFEVHKKELIYFEDNKYL